MRFKSEFPHNAFLIVPIRFAHLCVEISQDIYWALRLVLSDGFLHLDIEDPLLNFFAPAVRHAANCGDIGRAAIAATADESLG